MRVTIVGLGLMGGSLAMALTERSLCREVVGVARRPAMATLAAARGVVHRATTDLAEGVAAADVVVLATPVRTILRQLRELAGLPLGVCLVLDLGSTKQAIVAAMQALPPQVQPLGAHPMCGKETAGLAAAESTLYEGAPWVLVPLPRTSAGGLRQARELAEAVGGYPIVMDAARHDRLVAAVSHVPYLLAVALVLAAGRVGAGDDRVWELAASGFRDTSRLAASDVAMMLDILLTNQSAIGETLHEASVQLSRLADLLDAGDETALKPLLMAAHERRKPMFRTAGPGGLA
jgi:prephenate dehydrogenase